MSSFDAAAATYDAAFTYSLIGKSQRNQVYRHISHFSFRDKKMLELGAGTGEDARYFAQKGLPICVTEPAKNVQSIIQKKLSKYPKVELLRVSAQEAVNLPQVEQVNWVFSNFGALNCLDAEALAMTLQTLDARLPKSARITLVLMGTFCWWEWLYFRGKGRAESARRRASGKAVMAQVDGVQVPTHYYTPSDIIALLPSFTPVRLSPIGWSVPPSYMEPWVKKNKAVFRILNWVDKMVSGWSSFAYSSDHYCLTLERA